MERYYFAYGSNMDISQMAKRCPSSKLIGTGLLRNYRFSINTCGVATVIPQTEHNVYGVLWLITQEDEYSLDRYEGVCQNLYYKMTLTILESQGYEFEALIYMANDCQLGASRDGYIQRIIVSTEHHKLPEAYIEELKTWI